MKKFYLLALIASFEFFNAQSFTNGSVFDFSVGDTIVTQIDLVPGPSMSAQPPVTRYDIYTGKDMTTQPGTISYTTSTFMYQPAPCPTCAPGYTAVTNTFSVTNLTSSALNFPLPSTKSCTVVKDTSYIGQCQVNIHNKYNKLVTVPCFEPPMWDYKIIEGVGILFSYLTYTTSYPPSGYNVTLVSFSKVGKPGCGKVGIIPTGLNTYQLNEAEIMIYPNPVAEILTIKGLKVNTELQLFNSNGQLLRTIPSSKQEVSIDVADLSKGLYFIKSDDATVNKKFLKE